MTTQGLAPPSTRSEPTNARRRWRKLFSNKLHVFTVSLFLGLILVAIFADLIAPYGAVEVVGVPMGIISGYFGGKTDTIMMRTTDGLLAFPPIILAMATVAALGPNLRNTIIAIGVVQIPRFARLIRGQTLVLREAEFVVAARAIGGSHRYIMSTALLSNLMSLIFVQFTLTFATAVLTEAALSFLGLGAQPPHPSWGGMLDTGKTLLALNPWIAVGAGSAIFLTVLVFTLLGDTLNDMLKPS